MPSLRFLSSVVLLMFAADGPASERPRSHWAFRPPQRPVVPRPVDSDWGHHPIDAFLAVEHQKHQLVPRPLVDRGLLLRRVSLDLIGLPPTREQLHAFLNDSSPGAYERVVDQLLADPRHGERWGRHWMDVWRYSDWYGRRMVPDVWNSAPQVWRWRDWIVQSLNIGRGYDQMIREMLAGDELDPPDPRAAVATAFLVRNWYALNPNDWMRSNVEHVGKAFLGLTFNCAHCHDHKYDAISHEDYFRFRAYFEPLGVRQDRWPGEADPGPFQEYEYSSLRKIQRLGMVQAFDKTPEAPTWFYTGGDERNRVKEKGSLPPGLPAILQGVASEVRPIALPPAAYYPGLRPGIRETILTEQSAALAKAQAELAAARQAAERLPEMRQALAPAEAEFAAVRAHHPGALAGEQSLLLDATAGRRAIVNSLRELKSLDDGATLRFEFLILADAHFNLQLVRDGRQGLTAAYIGFHQGRIVSYRPKSTTEFDVGRYDPKTQDRLEVILTLLPLSDEARLRVRSRRDDLTLVDQVPVALNGWSPIGDPNKPLALDARTGSVVLVDDIVWTGPDGGRLMAFDFEPPTYADGADVIGVDGWADSSFGQAPATSQVSRIAASPELRAAVEKWRFARRPVEALEKRLRAAQAQVAASQADLAATRARIAADDAKYGQADDAASRAADALAAFRTASLAQAQAAVLTQEAAVAAAQAKPGDDANRAKELDAANQALTSARKALAQAQAAKLDSVPPLTPVYPATSTGRRTALAAAITHRDNPLTARVAVNHIWLRHFHAPLVPSVFDFGRNGDAPTHPELLDWLAVEFMESGWDMKRLHRLIVTSRAYQMASAQGDAADNAARDPENRLLWRMNVGRLEAEAVRDSLLYLAGRLDFTFGGQELENETALTTRRRSIYYSVHPEGNGKSPFGALFDAPDAGECYRRIRTVVPQQALALTNSDFVHDLSARLAASLPEPEPAAFVQAAFETILARGPRPAERTACLDFLNTPDPAARAALVRVLLNHNDFIAIR